MLFLSQHVVDVPGDNRARGIVADGEGLEVGCRITTPPYTDRATRHYTGHGDRSDEQVVVKSRIPTPVRQPDDAMTRLEESEAINAA